MPVSVEYAVAKGRGMALNRLKFERQKIFGEVCDDLVMW